MTFSARCLLTVLIILSACFAQKDYSMEVGFGGFVPKAFRNPTMRGRSDDVLVINQGALWRGDEDPSFTGGMVADFLFNRDKLSWGFGYEYHYDFHDIAEEDMFNLGDATSLKVFNQGIYMKALLHLKHEHKPSGFIGVKAGILGSTAGICDFLVNKKITKTNDDGSIRYDRKGVEREKDTYKLVDFTRFSPGLYTSLLMGFRIGVFNHLLGRLRRVHLRMGLRLTIELTLATPTIKFYKADLADPASDDYTINGYYDNPAFRLNYSGLSAFVTLYTSFNSKRDAESLREDDLELSGD